MTDSYSDASQTTREDDIASLKAALTKLSRDHERTYADMIHIENEMDDVRNQLFALGEFVQHD